MSYAIPSDIMTRYDVRRLGELVRDDNTRLTPGQLATDPILQMSLDDGTSLINAAILRGQKYKVPDLMALAGVDRALLLRINSDLAYGFLIRRRGYTEAEIGSLAPGFKGAQSLLQLLEEGSLVFNVPANIQAAVTVTQKMSTNVHLVSKAHRYFAHEGPFGDDRPE